MKNIAELRRRAAKGVELLKRVSDVKEAEVYVSVNDKFVSRLNFTSGIPCNGVQEPKSNAYSGTGVRAVFEAKDGSKVFGFGSEDKAISLEAVRKSLAKARKAAIADARFKSLPKPTGEKPAIENYHDPRVMNIRDADQVRKGWEALKGAIDAFREAGYKPEDGLSVTGDITIIREQMAVASTQGINEHDESTILQATITAMIEGKDSKGTGWAMATHLENFDAYGAGRMAARSAISGVGGVRIKSGRYNVIFDHWAVCPFFGLILPCFELPTIILGMSPLASKLGELVMPQSLSVYDDGTIPGSIATKRVTCEGLPTGRTDLVKDGRLVGFLADTYWANQFEAKNLVPRNGFRFGGGGRWHRSPPGVFPTNVSIEGEGASKEELLKMVGNGILIGRLWYLYPINGFGSGDFTGTAVGDSYLIENGKITRPLKVNAVRINENWLAMMREKFLGLSGERKPVMDWFAEEVVIAPWLAFRDVELEEIDVFLE